MMSSAEDRFWARVDKESSPGGCWLWQGAKVATGYGIYAFQRDGRRTSTVAHRRSYEFCVGPIPLGLEIDHLCRNRSCVNPAHLEPVTHRENTLRGSSLVAVNAKKTHCKNGHEFTPENTYVSRRGNGATFRVCRTCQRERPRRRSLTERGWSWTRSRGAA